jgi:Planctomycete cytochrome C
MKTAPFVLAIASVAALLGILGASGCVGASGKSDGAFFVAKVKPTLEYYCMECHNSKTASKFSHFNLETGKLAMSTGLHKPVILPGKPDESLLYVVLRLGHAEALAMPPAPDKISDEQLAAIHRWIRDGAFWPEGPEGHLKTPR